MWCGWSRGVFYAQRGRTCVGVCWYLYTRRDACTGVRQVNSKFARKDFLEATGDKRRKRSLAKKVREWWRERETETEPSQIRVRCDGRAFSRSPHSGIRGIMRLYCGSQSKVNCKCRQLLRKLGRPRARVQYPRSWNILISLFEAERRTGYCCEKRRY